MSVLKKLIYRKIHIIDSITLLENEEIDYNRKMDLILTKNFAVKHLISQLDGECAYFEKLQTKDILQNCNLNLQQFLQNWHKNSGGHDLFNYKGTNFGLSFRILIWSEIYEFARIFVNLETLKKVEFEELLVYSKSENLSNALNLLGIRHQLISVSGETTEQHFYFDHDRYMQDSLNRIKVIEKIIWTLFDLFMTMKINFLNLNPYKTNTRNVLCQVYHPTVNLLQKLRTYKDVNLITTSLIGNRSKLHYFKENYIPVRKRKGHLVGKSDEIIQNYLENRHARIEVIDGIDISAELYRIIDSRIIPKITEALSTIDSVEKYLKKFPIDLEIQVSNLGFFKTIVSCVLQGKGVVSYIIENGLLTSKFGDEGTFASFINSYGQSIRNNYFRDYKNVYCLGDPRMDYYINELPQKIVDRELPTIGIGTSGFNGVDMLSYPAIEFEFLFDILTAFESPELIGKYKRISVKLRKNCVLKDYEDFITHLFPTLNLVLIQDQPMSEFLRETDFYVSIYSQTLFEASAIGIPVIYYKIDDEVHYPPFDGESKLVTVSNLVDLIRAFIGFRNGDPMYDGFLDRSYMEQFVGPLDGKSLERNLEMITKILDAKMVRN